MVAGELGLPMDRVLWHAMVEQELGQETVTTQPLQMEEKIVLD